LSKQARLQKIIGQQLKRRKLGQDASTRGRENAIDEEEDGVLRLQGWHVLPDFKDELSHGDILRD